MGHSNVFIGHSAGGTAVGDHRLYIDNKDTATPLIYGEFNNSLLRCNGSLEVTASLKSEGARFKDFTDVSSGPYSVLAADHHIIATGTFTINLPAVASSANREIIITNKGAGTVTLDGNASETINGATTFAMNTQWEAFTLFCDGVEWFAR